MAFDAHLRDLRSELEAHLRDLHPHCADGPHSLIHAARHSLLAPAKRLRGVLVLICTEALGGARAPALDAAAAVEMLHAASLIIDDLPCMDDAQLRRGQPSNHTVFGEDTAILAAIGMIGEAFRVVSASTELSPASRVDIVGLLAQAIGYDGLVSGQFHDLRANPNTDLAGLQCIHHRKTGILFAAAAEIAGCVAGADQAERHRLNSFGSRLGQSFQAYDDLLDVLSDHGASGKDVGQDQDRVTMVSLVGLQAAHGMARGHIAAARSSINGSSHYADLVLFTDYIADAVLGQLDAAIESAATEDMIT